jgi:aminoglycoside 2''-phosphotransferase
MHNAIVAYLPRICQIAPDLVVKSARVNTDGLANEVVVVNGEVVFRFARGEYGRESLRRELQVLEALRGQVAVALPEPFYTSEDAIAYRYLHGEDFTRHTLASLDAQAQQAIADQVAEFLSAMHAIYREDLPATAAPVDRAQFMEQRQRVREKVYPLLLPHQAAWAESVYAYLDQPGAFAYQAGLVHGDLAPYHLLFDPRSAILGGVIDFGVAGLGDPASDLGALLQNYGLGFVRRLEICYPRAIDLLPRARFYGQAIELQWVLRGLESGDSFWFTAHLGGTRDF